MRYIYNQDGSMLFIQRDQQVYDEEGQFLIDVKIGDPDVYFGTEYAGQVFFDIFYPNERFNEDD